MTQLALEDVLEEDVLTTLTQLTLEDALEDNNDTVNIGGVTRRPQ